MVVKKTQQWYVFNDVLRWTSDVVFGILLSDFNSIDMAKRRDGHLMRNWHPWLQVVFVKRFRRSFKMILMGHQRSRKHCISVLLVWSSKCSTKYMGVISILFSIFNCSPTYVWSNKCSTKVYISILGLLCIVE